MEGDLRRVRLYFLTLFFQARAYPLLLPFPRSVEPYWGLFNANKTLKAGVVIPDCAAP
jgi:hypothetical protein